MGKKSRMHRVVLDITLNKPVAGRTAVSFMREVLGRVDWNEREFIVGLYCDRAEAKSFLRVVEGLQSQGEQVAHVYVTEGPTYEEVVAENARLKAMLGGQETNDPAAIYDENTIDF